MKEYCELHDKIEVVKYQYVRDGERTNIFRCAEALIPEVDFDIYNIEDWIDLETGMRLNRSDYILERTNWVYK